MTDLLPLAHAMAHAATLLPASVLLGARKVTPRDRAICLAVSETIEQAAAATYRDRPVPTRITQLTHDLREMATPPPPSRTRRDDLFALKAVTSRVHDLTAALALTTLPRPSEAVVEAAAA